MIKTIIFDLGRVLFDFQGGLDNLAQRLNTSVEELYPVFIKNDPDICTGKITPKELLQRYEQEFGTISGITNFSEYWASFLNPIHPTLDLLIELYKKGFDIGILTNIYPNTLKILKEQHLLPDITYTVITESCEIGVVKPNPKIFEYTQQQLIETNPKEVLFIDDSKENCIAAEEFGWNTYHFKKEIDSIKHIENLRVQLLS
jgi:putative hydrolase of the HAD superfamily